MFADLYQNHRYDEPEPHDHEDEENKQFDENEREPDETDDQGGLTIFT